MFHATKFMYDQLEAFVKVAVIISFLYNHFTRYAGPVIGFILYAGRTK